MLAFFVSLLPLTRRFIYLPFYPTLNSVQVAFYVCACAIEVTLCATCSIHIYIWYRLALCKNVYICVCVCCVLWMPSKVRCRLVETLSHSFTNQSVLRFSMERRRVEASGVWIIYTYGDCGFHMLITRPDSFGSRFQVHARVSFSLLSLSFFYFHPTEVSSWLQNQKLPKRALYN